MKKKKLMISLITTLLVIIVLIGVAYALLRFKINGEKNQVLRIGDLELKLDETGNTLGLESGEILSDEEGLSLQGFDFTLKNDSRKTVDYTIYLDDVELDSPTDVRLEDKYLKYSLDKNGVKGEAKPLTDTGVNPERVLEQGQIGKNQQNDYTLRLWVTSDEDGDITDQVFKAKIRVENTLIPNDINIDNNNIVLDLNGKKEEQININKEELGEVTYQSKDKQVADVTPEGLITAVGLGSTEIEVTSGSYKDVIRVKVQKTVEAIYVKQGLGVQEIEKESDSCILTSKEEVCEKTLPTITMKSDEYTAVGWSEVKDSEKGQNGKITFQDNVKYYAISYKNEVPYKVLFDGNGNVIDEEEKNCSLPRSYNDIPQPMSCTVTTPTIEENPNTPTIIGYSTTAEDHTKTVGSNEELEVNEENNETTYYAQTKSEGKEVTATFTPQNSGSFLVDDLSDKKNDGKVYGNPKYSGEGIILDGVDDYVDCGYANEDFKNTFSTIIRFKLNSIPSGGYIIGNAEAAGMNLGIDKNRNLYFNIHDGTSYRSKTPSTTIELNTWYEVAMIFNGTKIEVYLNGSLVDTLSFSNPVNMKVSTMPFYIGANPNNGGCKWFDELLNVTISKASIYKRVLSSDEISTSYTNKTIENKNGLLFSYDFTKAREKKASCMLKESYNGSLPEGCEVTVPEVKVREGYNFLGWNHNKESQEGEISKVKVTNDTTFYAITKKDIKITYDKNGSTAVSKENDSCTMWNSTDSCRFTAPTVTVSDNTPIKVGWSLFKDHNVNRWSEGTERDLSENLDFYAQTKKDAVTKNVVYQKTTGVDNIGKGSDQCTIAATWNGKAQATSCTVQAPTITAESGYYVIGWNTSNVATTGTKAGQNLTLTNATTTYYAIAVQLLPAVETLLSNYTNPESTQDYDVNYTKTDKTAKENKMYVFNHEAGTQQNGWSSDELKDYRYIGANPNNYVTFNNETAGWRIVGIFTVEDENGKKEKRIKIVRTKEIGDFSWDNRNIETGAEDDNGSNDWTTARIMKLLNPNYQNETGGSLYWNRESGFCYNAKNNASIACDFKEIGLTTEARNLIGQTKWYLGSLPNFPAAKEMYSYERGTDVYHSTTNPRKTNAISYIALLYPSDYGYATSGGTTTSRSNCLEMNSSGWGQQNDCYNNNYLYSNKNEWLLSPCSFIAPGFSLSAYVTNRNVNGYVGATNTFWSGSIFPTLYLKSDAKIVGGDGSSSNPFVFVSPSSSDQGIEGPSSISITSKKEVLTSPSKVCQEEVSTGTSYNFDIDSTSEIKTGSVCTTSNNTVVCIDYNNDLDITSNKSCMSGNSVTTYTKSTDSCSYVYVCDNNNKCSAKREC